MKFAADVVRVIAWCLIIGTLTAGVIFALGMIAGPLLALCRELSESL